MLISPNNGHLPCIYKAHRDMAQVLKGSCEYGNRHYTVFKRNYPFQRSYLHLSSADTDTGIYNIANKVEPLRKNHVGRLIDIYA